MGRCLAPAAFFGLSSIDAKGKDGQSVFGTIEQKAVALGDKATG